MNGRSLVGTTDRVPALPAGSSPSPSPSPQPAFDDTAALQRLLDVELSADLLWEDHELADVLQHQLDAPLAADLQLLGSVPALRAAQLCEAAQPQIHSLRDLFRHPAPPAELLGIVGQFAHAELTASAEPVLNRDVARLIFYSAIGLAREKCRCDLALANPSEDVADALNSLARANWVDADTAQVLRQCAASLTPPPTR
jgi:hypothetical protein